MTFTIQEIEDMLTRYAQQIDERQFPDAHIAIGRLRSLFWQRDREKEGAAPTTEESNG